MDLEHINEIRASELAAIIGDKAVEALESRGISLAGDGLAGDGLVNLDSAIAQLEAIQADEEDDYDEADDEGDDLEAAAVGDVLRLAADIEWNV